MHIQIRPLSTSHPQHAYRMMRPDPSEEVCHLDGVSHVVMPQRIVPKPRHCTLARDFKSTLCFEVSRGENRPTCDHETRPEGTKASEDVLPPTRAPQVRSHSFFRPPKARFGDLDRAEANVRNLVSALLHHEVIKTTVPKAKEAARMAEKVIRTDNKPVEQWY